MNGNIELKPIRRNRMHNSKIVEEVAAQAKLEYLRDSFGKKIFSNTRA